MKQLFIPKDYKSVFTVKSTEKAIKQIKDFFNYAKELLIENRLTITEIAYSLGFDNIHYFSTVFNKWTKVSPSAYRYQIHSEEK